jgi:hypothetical protein
VWIKQGISQGISQRNYEVARNLISLNTPFVTISKATGLSEAELRAIQADVSI